MNNSGDFRDHLIQMVAGVRMAVTDCTRPVTGIISVVTPV